METQTRPGILASRDEFLITAGLAFLPTSRLSVGRQMVAMRLLRMRDLRRRWALMRRTSSCLFFARRSGFDSAPAVERVIRAVTL